MDLSNIFKKPVPVPNDVIIEVNEDGCFLLPIEDNPELFDYLDIHPNGDLTDIIEYYKIGNFPEEEGEYSCKMFTYSYQSNHPLDPVEWDLDIWFEDFNKIT